MSAKLLHDRAPARQGGELLTKIQASSFYSESQARTVVSLLLSTLDHLHGRGVVHRDLKPDNILLASKDDLTHIKLADFGFAKAVEDLVGERTICGSPHYIAPEILRKVPYGAPVDIWSCGVILFILLGGYPPFDDEDEEKLFLKIKQGNFQFGMPQTPNVWREISPHAKDLISRMLQVDPKKRPTARACLTHPWFTTKQNAPLSLTKAFGL